MKTKLFAGIALSAVIVLSIFSSTSIATGHTTALQALNLPIPNENLTHEGSLSEPGYAALMDTVFGCTYSWAVGYNPEANFDDGSCQEFCCPGDMNGDNYINVNDLIALLGIFDTYCDDSIIYGCTDPGACNFNPDANSDDGLCEYIYGCLDPSACNFDPNACLEDPTIECVYPDDDGLCCGCNANGSQLDFSGPTFTLIPNDQSNECNEQPYEYAFSDACMSNDVILVEEIRDTLSGDDCGNYHHLVTVAATDSCGNTSSIQFNIIVQDTDEPYLFLGEFPNDTTLSCTEEWPEIQITSGFDNCDGPTPVFFNETIIDGECAGSYEILRTWLMQDCSGNEQMHQQIITVLDDELPFFTLVPENQVNQCAEEPYAYEAFDNCNDVTVVETRDTLYADSCGNYEHLVTLTANDSCGNFADTTFMISVFDTEAPMWTNDEFPQTELTVSCEEIPTPWEFAALDSCDGEINVEFSEESSDLECPSATTLTRMWVASDCSGNSINYTQTIFVTDTLAPAFVETLPEDLVVECDSIPEAAVLTAVDNCDEEVTVTFTEVLVEGDCPQRYTLERSWLATDCVGNSVEHSQTLEVQDSTSPTFTVLPEDQSNQCEEQPYTYDAEDNCSAVSITESREVLSEDECGNYEHLVTLTALDECGNSTIYQFTIIIQDTEAPTFVEELPADVVVECDAIPSAAVLNAVDNCDDVGVNFTEVFTPGDCAQSYTLTRTWEATDCSGNLASHTQIVQVEDTTPPSFVDAPDDQVNQCEEAPYSTEAIDNCASVSIVETRDTLSTDTCGNYQHLVTLTASDACGNVAVHSFTITVEDTEAPVFVEELPENESLNCSDGIPAAALLSAIDNCDVVDVTFAEDTVTSACVTTFIRTWEAVDCSGNSIVHSQEVLVTDDVAPVFTSLPNSTISLESDLTCNADTSVLALGTPSVDDACSGWQLEYTDTEAVILCIGSYSFERIWIATDDCGNAAEFTQSIEVLDTEGPTLEVPAADLTVECESLTDQNTLDEWLGTQGGALASDNCSEVTWSHDFTAIESSCAGGFSTVTFTAMDDCGNTTSTTATIEFTDSTPPNLVTAAVDQTVACDVESNEAALSDWLEGHGGAEASDACSEITWSNDFIGLSDDCGSTGSATVTFTASDACGNSITTTATFNIEDTTAPVITDAVDFTAECDGFGNAAELEAWLANNGSATASDACGEVTWSNDFIAVGDGCGATGATAVTFTATDACGNSALTTAIFTIIDTTGPTITTEPQALVVECDGAGNTLEIDTWLANAGGGMASDLCSDVSWSNDYAGLEGACGATGATIVTFTAIDACGNTASAEATVTIQDTTGPSIETAASDLIVECDGAGNGAELEAWLLSMGGASAADNCSEVTWSNNYELLDPTCGNTGTAVIDFTATDACGNTSVTTATFVIIDTELPQFTALPIDQNSQCEELAFEAFAVDNCSDVEILETREVLSEDECGNYEHLVTLTAVDACGNEATHQFTIIVQDTIAPTWNESIPADITIGCGELEGAPVITASDNCDASVDVVFTEETIGEETGCTLEYDVIRTWTATDCSGNVTTATQVISIADETLPEWDVEIEEFVIVECSEIPDPSLVTASDDCDADVTVAFEEELIPSSCPNRFTLIRTWTASDECGNSITASQTLSVVDTTEPEWVGELPPSNITVSSCDDIPEAPVLEAVDNCDGETFVVFNEFYSPLSGCSDVCTCGGIVIRTWITSDCVGNLATFVQYYNVLGQE